MTASRVRPLAGLATALLITATAATMAASLPARAVSAAPSLAGLVEEIGRELLARFPEEATELGLSEELGLDDRALQDLSRASLAETAELAEASLARLDAVDPGKLSVDERITLAVTQWWLRDLVTMAGFADHEYALSYITGAHATFGEFMADVHPLADLDDAEAYVARLRAVGDQLGQVAERLAYAQREGMLPTQRGIDIARWQLDEQLGPAVAHPLLTDLRARLEAAGLAQSERERLLAEARAALEEATLPAYRELLGVASTLGTRPDDTPGVLQHPDGAAYYEAALRHHTTTSLTPMKVHELGLREVDRLRTELTEALETEGFSVEALDLAGAIEAVRAATPAIALRSDADREVLLQQTQARVDEAEDAFRGMFRTMPQAALEVQRPRPGREAGAGAYYRPPPASGDRPGIYYLSMALDRFETDTYATTNYHEAVPGHHLQVSLQRESSALPLVQRAVTFNGYAEGWALYAERLAYEAGLYADDPLGNIGRLRLELLRAARAVADTGIHALGWSRDEAIAYLVELGFPPPWAAQEVDRYIVWPGQAPAYIVGLLEILRLRDEAQTALGDRFDLAAFHDAILRHGSLPLEVLPLAVESWVQEAAAR